jgi:hypothetical protein
LFTTKCYPQEREKQAEWIVYVAFALLKTRADGSLKNFASQACMLNTLIEYPFAQHSSRDPIK